MVPVRANITDIKTFLRIEYILLSTMMGMNTNSRIIETRETMNSFDIFNSRQIIITAKVMTMPVFSFDLTMFSFVLVSKIASLLNLLQMIVSRKITYKYYIIQIYPMPFRFNTLAKFLVCMKLTMFFLP